MKDSGKVLGIVGVIGCLGAAAYLMKSPSELMEYTNSSNQRVVEFMKSSSASSFYSGVRDQLVEREKMLGFSTTFFAPELNAKRLERSLCISDEIQYTQIERDLIDNFIKNPSGLDGLTSGLDKINSVDLNVIQYDIDFSKRDSKTLAYNEATLKARFDLRGESSQVRKQNTGLVELKVKKDGGVWKLLSHKILNKDERIAKHAPRFASMTKKSGIDQVPVHLRREAIRRGGYALTVSDYNGDKNLDIFVGAMGKSTAWKNQGELSFAQDQDANFVGKTLVKSAIFADFDNDGRDDLVTTRFTFNKLEGVLHFYRNTGKGFEPWDNGLNDKELDNYAMPAATGDFNGDGFLDLYVGFPGRLDFTQAVNPIVNDERSTYQGLYLNGPDRRFAEASANLKDVHNSYVYPHASIAVDYDSDGDMDIMVIDDRNNLSPMYQNKGDGTFVQVADQIGIGNNAYGMGIDFADLNNDGHLDALISNVNLPSNERISNSCQRNFAFKNQPLPKHQGLRYFVNNGKNQFVEKTVEANLADVGYGAAGFVTFDYDNDGDLDIYMTNGLWSAGDGREEVGSILTFNHLIGEEGVMDKSRGTPQHERKEEGILDGLITKKGSFKHPGQKNFFSLAAYQRNKLFKNNGDGTFTDVGYFEGVDSISDGYMVAVGDLNKDGKQDLILRNADPGHHEFSYPAVEIFENKVPAKNNVLRISMSGNMSNKNAIGTRLYVENEGQVQYRQIIANNGAVQSERTAHFGLGKDDVADKVTIIWPGGQKLVLENLKAGSYEFSDSQTLQKFAEN